jgi:hypothetical protein
MRKRSLVAVLAVASLAAAAEAQSPQPRFRFQTVALSEWAAPGTEAGVTYGPLPDTAPQLGEAGHVSFFAQPLVGPGVTAQNNIALYAGMPGAVRLLARAEAEAPDTPPGVLFNAFGTIPLVNSAGNVAFGAELKGPGVVTGENQNLRGIWAGSPGAVRLIAREGDPAAGAPEGVRYSVLQSGLRVWNDVGHVAFSGQVTGAGVSAANDSGLWAGSPGNIQLVARDGSPAPGTGGGVSYGSFQFGVIQINNAGQTVFENGLAGPVNASNNHAIFSGPPGGVQLAARLGQQAAGLPAGVRYEAMRNPRINDQGQIVFTGTASGHAGIWAGLPGAFQLVAYGGGQAPGTPEGVSYHDMGLPIVSSSGGVAFPASLRNPNGQDLGEGLFAGVPGSVQLIARRGADAAGTEPGVAFQRPENFALNGAGQVVFLASLTGPDVTEANDYGIWSTDPLNPGGPLLLVAREGGLFDVGGGDLRTISELRFLGDAVSGSALNDAGQFAFAARFTDGSGGVFVTGVPEPGAAAVTASVTAGAALLRRRQRHNYQARAGNGQR